MLHKDKSGKLTPIASLEDSHLVNIVKYHFKEYSVGDTKMTEYLMGKSLPKMTPDVFYSILHERSLYIIEGLRRDSTREDVCKVLGKFNPIFEITSKVEIPTDSLKFLSRFDDRDIHEEYDFSDLNN
jgi:hypothetical protein